MAAAKRVDPRCPIIVTSGHPSSEGEMRLIGHPRAVFLPKPFGAELIQRTVAELLSAAVQDRPAYRVPEWHRLVERESARTEPTMACKAN